MKLTSCFESLIGQSVCHVLKDKPDQFTGPLGLLWLAQTALDANIGEEMRDVAQMCESCSMCWRACPSETNFLEDAIKGVLRDEKLDNNREEERIGG